MSDSQAKRQKTEHGCKVSCLCGACQVETTCAPKWVANCHCSQCRRALSASYATLAGFDPETVKVCKGESNLVSHTTGKEERFSCKTCSSKVYAHLHHLNHKAIYNDMFTAPNHGPDGKIGSEFAPTMHIFYTSGNTNIVDGLPKYTDLPAAFGGSDKKVDEVYHKPAPSTATTCKASCLCGACQVETTCAPKWVVNCHCSQCRRALSASYATLAGFDPETVKVCKGESNLVSHTTGKEERFSCKICSSKVYAHLHHLNHKAIYNDMFTTPNHGPDGKIGTTFAPTMHIFYPSGNTNIVDGLPKYTDLPAAFGGSDKKVDEASTKTCTASCLCGACKVETTGVPKWVVNCHCSQCRRAMTAAYATLAGFDPESVKVTKGESNLVSHTTGKEERLSCKSCNSKVYAHLHHLNHKAIYNDMFTTPNHGPDGTIGKEFAPAMHIFYTSGNTNVIDGLPKYTDLPAAFGGSDKTVDENFHFRSLQDKDAKKCVASCLCGTCQVETVGVPKWVVNCHCSQCRRALSATYATLCGFDPESIKVTKGESSLVSHTTGKEERFSCKECSSKVYAHLHHLNHKAIYNDAFTTPNHGPDGKIGKEFAPSMHIFYTSGNTHVADGLPKYVDLPAAFGGSDKNRGKLSRAFLKAFGQRAVGSHIMV